MTEQPNIVRLQYDVRRAQWEMMLALMQKCGITSKGTYFHNAMALMRWAVTETEKGHKIISMNPDTGDMERVELPALKSIGTHDTNA